MPPEEPTPTAAPAATPTPEPIAAPAPIAEVTILTPEPVPVPLEIIAEPAAAETPTETAVEEKPAEAAPSHTDVESLLEKAGKPEEKPKTEEKPVEAKPKEPIKAYEPFTFPEGVPVDEARIKAFTEIAGPDKLDQETAQKLVDLHTSTLKQLQDHLYAEQHRVFAETRSGWVDKIMQDPILGGSGHQTALMAAARMRDLLVPEPFRAEFAEFMRTTGAGDHPALFRLLHNAARLFDEPAAPPIAARPAPDRGPGKPTRGAVMYDHPSSRKVAGR